MKHRTMALVVFIVLFSLPLISNTSDSIPFYLLERGSFLSSEDWIETGNSSITLETPEWNQAGNATITLQTPNLPAEFNFTFEETLSDDVLYYPDMYVQEATYGNVSGAETNNYTYMLEDDASYWQNAHGGSDGYSYIDVEGPILAESVNVTINALASGPIATHTVYLYLVNPSGTDLLICQDTGVGAGDAEIDGTYTISDWISYEANGNHTFYLKSLQGGANPVSLLGDYFHISPVVGYAESFSDVNEWSLVSDEGTSTFVTDGDVLTLFMNDDGAGDSDRLVMTDISIPYAPNIYCEARYKFADADDQGMWLYAYETAPYGGESEAIFTFINYGDGKWKTIKTWFDDTFAIDSLNFYAYLNGGGDLDGLLIDYIRIGPSNDMGWQHDGSTVSDLLLGGSATATTDGDKINITTSGASGNYALFYADITTTESYIELGYYPFIEWSITNVHDDNSDGNVWFLRGFNATDFELIYSPNDDTGIFRANLETLSLNEIRRLGFYAEDAGDSFILDYVKIYGIANWSITQTGCTIDDYLYDDNGTLTSTSDTGGITLEYDPSFNLGLYYRSWNKTESSGTSYLSFYTNAWTDYSAALLGKVYGGNITGARIYFNASASIDVVRFHDWSSWLEIGSALIYLDTPEWESIATAIIGFFVPFSNEAMQWYLSIIGCVLIPLSTVVLAKGSKDGMSRDKFFLFLIVFFIGWGLLLGGIA